MSKSHKTFVLQCEVYLFSKNPVHHCFYHILFFLDLTCSNQVDGYLAGFLILYIKIYTKNQNFDLTS